MKKMLYILNVANKVNNFSYSSMLAAQKSGFEFHIAGNWYGYNLYEEQKADEEKYGIKIHQIDFIRKPYDLRNIRAYKQVCELIKKEKYDVIHCNTPIGGVIGRVAGTVCNVKEIIYQAHGFHFYAGASWINWLVYYPIERILSHMTDCLITINQEDYDIAKTMKLRKKEQVCLVHGVGIDLTQFNGDDHVLNLKRSDLNIAQETIVMISIGELNKNKNIEVIIEAMHLIDNKLLHYIICGEGKLRDDLEKRVNRYNLQDRVHFLGFRNDVYDLLKLSDVFVMPSKREGLSRSLMEAMASGLPCIVSDIRGNVDLIEEGRGGYLRKVDDIEGFKDAIEKMIKDVSLRRKMGKYNLEVIRQYDIEIVKKELMKIYKNI